MKPEFCVQIEKQLAQNEQLKNKYSAIAFDGKEDTVNSRFQRVLRMKDLETQCNYLAAFIEIW